MRLAYETPTLRRLAALGPPGARFRIACREAGAARGVEALKGEPIARGQIRRQGTQVHIVLAPGPPRRAA